MRVAVVLEQALAPVPGGTGRYAVELAAALARTANRQDVVTSWTAWHRAPSAARLEGVLGPRRLPLGRRPLIAAWERGLGPGPREADLVHAPTLFLPPTRRPLVVTIHDAVPWTHPETLTPRGVRWHRRMADLAARRAAAVTVPTHAVADELSRVLPSVADRVHVLGAGVSRALLTEPDARAIEAAGALGLPEPYLISLATLEPRKGLDVLIRALALLGGDAPTLAVVGQPGWGGVDLNSVAGEAGLDLSRIRQLGRLDDATLGAVLRGAHALVMPSRAEGFGLPVAEAMALGVAVVCSDAPALTEVAGDAALVVPRDEPAALAEAIDAVLRDDALRQRLARAGSARAAQFDWDLVARRAWRLYAAVLEGRSGSATE